MIRIMMEDVTDIEETRSRIALIIESSASMEEVMIEVRSNLAAVDAKERSEEKEDQAGMSGTIALTTHEREIESTRARKIKKIRTRLVVRRRRSQRKKIMVMME